MLFGIDLAEQNKALFAGRVALITSPSGRTADNAAGIDRLRELCDLRLLLAPEHGVRGDQAAGAGVESGTDRISGLPMMSMYRKGSQRLPEEAFELFDTLVYDIQDVGCRYYTFISTLKNAMEDCAAKGKRVIVLDRPDPLGSRTEGSMMAAENRNFVGCWTMPVMYGLTCGEFAQMIRAEDTPDLDLHIIRCEGLEKNMTFRDWKRPWLLTSPAIPRIETVMLYPGTCLLEGTNVSEGRGTADPFALIGAPFIDAESFSAGFNRLQLPGVLATPYWFTPYTSKFRGELCGGLHLHITDGAALRPTELGVKLLELLRNTYPDDFRILPAGDPLQPLPFISMLAGHREFEKPDWSADAVIEKARADCAAFDERADQYRIYK